MKDPEFTVYNSLMIYPKLAEEEEFKDTDEITITTGPGRIHQIR
jgi:hypothetical protein